MHGEMLKCITGKSLEYCFVVGGGVVKLFRRECADPNCHEKATCKVKTADGQTLRFCEKHCREFKGGE